MLTHDNQVFQIDTKTGIPIYITGSHNYALYPWYDLYDRFGKSFNVIVLDRHFDVGGILNPLYSEFLSGKISKYEFISQVNNGHFISYALKEKIIKDLVFLTPEKMNKSSSIEEIRKDGHLVYCKYEISQVINFLRNIYDSEGKHFRNDKLVLDIDFDYFTQRWDGVLYPFHPSIIADIMNPKSKSQLGLLIRNDFYAPPNVLKDERILFQAITISFEKKLYTGPDQALIESFLAFLDELKPLLNFEYETANLRDFILAVRQG